MGKAFGQVTDNPLSSDELSAEQKDRAREYRRAFAYERGRSDEDIRAIYEPFYTQNREKLTAFYNQAVRIAARAHYLSQELQGVRAPLNPDEVRERNYLNRVSRILIEIAPGDEVLVAKRQLAREFVNAAEGVADASAAASARTEPPVEYDQKGQAMTPVPGGSSSYASVSEARAARIEEYIGQLTGEAKERAEQYWNYYTTIYADSSPNWQRVGAAERYVASMFCPKPDPLGRFILCDITSTQPGGTGVTVWLAGSAKKSGGTWAEAKAVQLGSGYSGGQQSIEGDTFNRSHTPDGVAIEGAGLGTVLYSAHALAAYVYSDAAGCYSDSGRSSDADEWWTNAKDKGFAESAAGGTEEEDVDHCETISDSQYEEPARRGGRSGTIIDYEVCGTVRVEFGSDEEVDILYTRKVVKAGFLAFGVLGTSDPTFAGPWEYPVGAKHRPFWDALANDVGRTDSPRNSLFIGREGQGDGPYNLGADGKLTVKLTPKRAEMFSRAMHGPSPVLAASILEALAANDYHDYAVQYAVRPDIAPLLASNKRLAELIGQQRLPGLGGMPAKAHARIMGALGQAQRGELRLDLGKQNPLGFKPMSPTLRADVAKYGELG